MKNILYFSLQPTTGTSATPFRPIEPIRFVQSSKNDDSKVFPWKQLLRRRRVRVTRKVSAHLEILINAFDAI